MNIYYKDTRLLAAAEFAKQPSVDASVLGMPRMSGEKKPSIPLGRPLAIDPNALSASRTEPAFIAIPPGAPVYHGFQILDDVSVDGFVFGKITDFEAEPCDRGDAFVIAPDNSRAGLVWDVSSEYFFREVCPLEPDRWGVWSVSFPHPMTSRDNVHRNLGAILPELKKRWEEWQQKFAKE